MIAAALAAAGLGSLVAGCSDLYWDHRETVGLSSGDAVAANEVTQMVDPWPRNSGNRNIAYNGQKMQAAVERYRTGRVIPPVSPTTSDVEVPAESAPAPPLSSGAQSNPSGATATATASQ